MKPENSLKVKITDEDRLHLFFFFPYFLFASVVTAKTLYIFGWNRSRYFRHRGVFAEFNMIVNL